MNQKELLKLGENILKQANIQYAYLKATILLEYILKQTKQQLLIKSEEQVNEIKEKEYKNSIEKIKKGIPLQYIIHNQTFMAIEFYVDENVLIPQPDTEILVEETMKIINKLQKSTIKVLDLCTGSGAIAISIAKYCKNVDVTATDISEKALKVAIKNAKQNNVNIKFIKSDLFKNIEEKQFDIIVSNPPYVETKIIQTLSKEVQNEPYIALDGGEDGLKFYRNILIQAHNYLNKDGYILLEIGYNQGEKVLQLEQKNLKIITKEPIKDLEKNDRVIVFQKNMEE